MFLSKFQRKGRIGPGWVVYRSKTASRNDPNFTDSQTSTSLLCFEYQSDPPPKKKTVFSKEDISYDIRPLYTTSQTCGGLESVAPSLTQLIGISDLSLEAYGLVLPIHNRFFFHRKARKQFQTYDKANS